MDQIFIHDTYCGCTNIPGQKGQERTRPDKSPLTQDFEMAYEYIKIFTYESVHQYMYIYNIDQHFLIYK